MLQVQMQLEADQQLAALQQQSRPQMQREWVNGPMGNAQAFHGHQSNASHNGTGAYNGTGMMSQGGSPMDDSPPNQLHASGALLGLHHFLSLSFCVCKPLNISLGLTAQHCIVWQ